MAKARNKPAKLSKQLTVAGYDLLLADVSSPTSEGSDLTGISGIHLIQVVVAPPERVAARGGGL